MRVASVSGAESLNMFVWEATEGMDDAQFVRLDETSDDPVGEAVRQQASHLVIGAIQLEDVILQLPLARQAQVANLKVAFMALGMLVPQDECGPFRILHNEHEVESWLRG